MARRLIRPTARIDWPAMGTVRPPRLVKPICGLISNDPDLMARAAGMLREHLGPTDGTSPTWPFDTTDYYTAEMGECLLRQFISFERLIDPVALAGIKILTNELEQRICYDCGLPGSRRPVNLDPGYLTLSKLVLATTKDYTHRIYLRDGIYAEVTLHYHDGRWQPWPWTYPDYADGRYFAFFEQVRERLKEKLSTLPGDVPSARRRPA